MKEIKNLFELKQTLDKIDNNTLTKYGVGFNYDSDCEVSFLRESTDIDDTVALWEIETKKYPELTQINNWIKAVIRAVEFWNDAEMEDIATLDEFIHHGQKFKEE